MSYVAGYDGSTLSAAIAPSNNVPGWSIYLALEGDQQGEHMSLVLTPKEARRLGNWLIKASVTKDA